MFVGRSDLGQLVPSPECAMATIYVEFSQQTNLRCFTDREGSQSRIINTTSTLLITWPPPACLSSTICRANQKRQTKQRITRYGQGKSLTLMWLPLTSGQELERALHACVGKDLKHGYLRHQGKKGPYMHALGGTLNMVIYNIRARKSLTCMHWEGP